MSVVESAVAGLILGSAAGYVGHYVWHIADLRRRVQAGKRVSKAQQFGSAKRNLLMSSLASASVSGMVAGVTVFLAGRPDWAVCALAFTAGLAPCTVFPLLSGFRLPR